ncbi:MAG: hypothetical protein K9K82_11290 [Desulfobacteraceae bacterium]|nr:hypothetical protein [Desulfobacteraceae bacterium]
MAQHPLHGTQAELNRILKKWHELEESLTVIDDRICPVNSGVVDRPSPRLVKGLEKLARLIHPELFEADSENN